MKEWVNEVYACEDSYVRSPQYTSMGCGGRKPPPEMGKDKEQRRRDNPDPLPSTHGHVSLGRREGKRYNWANWKQGSRGKRDRFESHGGNQATTMMVVRTSLAAQSPPLANNLWA